MPGRRYTVVVADRSSGVVRQLTVNRRWLALAIATILAIPVLMGLGAKWSANAQIEELLSTNTVLLVENGSYRVATGELTGQIQSLEIVINDLGTRSMLDPAQARAMQRLPAVVRSRAAGGTNANTGVANSAISRPDFLCRHAQSRSTPRKTHLACSAICSTVSKAASASCAATSNGAKRSPPRRRPSGRRMAG